MTHNKDSIKVTIENKSFRVQVVVKGSEWNVMDEFNVSFAALKTSSHHVVTDMRTIYRDLQRGGAALRTRMRRRDWQHLKGLRA